MKELNKLIELPFKYEKGEIVDGKGRAILTLKARWLFDQYGSWEEAYKIEEEVGNLIAHALNNLHVDISEKSGHESGTCRLGKDEIEVATDNAIAHAELWEGKMSAEREEGIRYGFSEAIGFLNNLGTKSGDSTDSVKDANQNGDNLQPTNDWRTMESAPKDEEIEVAFDEQKTETCIAVWSERPVCMLGPVNGGFPAGWATAGGQTDSNLPLDTPLYWRSIPNNLDATHHPTEVSAGHQPKEGEMQQVFDNEKHFTKCNVCGEVMDMRDLRTVFAHEHDDELPQVGHHKGRPVSGERTGEESEGGQP